MAKKASEYDYLHISARVRAMENRLLTRERMERMLDARSADEAAKVLAECGYGDLPSLTPTVIERALSQARQGLLAELRKVAPDQRLLDVFCIKYDYHNIKVLIKAAARGVDGAQLLLDAGRYDLAQLREDFEKGELSHTSPTFRAAAEQAREALSQTGDPKKADFILDRAYYEELLQAAKDTGSSFLLEYARVSIDAANLRAVVRVHRMGAGASVLREVLVPGGSVSTDRLLSAGGGELSSLFLRTPLEEAAAIGASALEGGSLTAFERACDNGVMSVVRTGRTVPFGEQALVGYLYAKEAEFTAIRVILTGKLAGLDRSILEERLRDSYA